MRESREFKVSADGDEFSIVEWPGDSDPVLMLHATGFHSRCWTQVVESLPGQHIYAVDLRYHGDSDATGEVDWRRMAHDMRLVVEHLDLRRAVGVGHSIGGHLIARAAAAHPQRFKQLVLVDPVIMSPDTYAEMAERMQQVSAHDHPVSRRKNKWIDADEMFNRFSDRHPFRTWQPEVLRDYCDYALRPVSDADYMELACDPINEASIYVCQTGNEVVHADLPNIVTPTTLLRASTASSGTGDLSASPTWPELASALPNCREIYLPKLNHFIPMQDPSLVARIVIEAQADLWQRVSLDASEA